jgi:hypothetical protein
MQHAVELQILEVASQPTREPGMNLTAVCSFSVLLVSCLAIPKSPSFATLPATCEDPVSLRFKLAKAM